MRARGKDGEEREDTRKRGGPARRGGHTEVCYTVGVWCGVKTQDTRRTRARAPGGGGHLADLLEMLLPSSISLIPVRLLQVTVGLSGVVWAGPGAAGDGREHLQRAQRSV